MDDLNDASARLILHMHVKDCQSISDQSRTDQNEHEAIAFETARELYQDDLEDMGDGGVEELGSVHHVNVNHNVVHAIEMPADQVNTEEYPPVAYGGLSLDSALQGPSNAASARHDPGYLDDRFLHEPVTIPSHPNAKKRPYEETDDDATPGDYVDSAHGSKKPKQGEDAIEPDPIPECAACGVEKQQFLLHTLSCEHNYCRECLAGMYRTSMSADAAFPPACCARKLPWNDRIRRFLGKNTPLVTGFTLKTAEFASKDRTYCSDPACGNFVPAVRGNTDRAHCLSCGQTTCINCKRADHEGDCAPDVSKQVFMNTATSKGWKTCYKCQDMIEKIDGCNHITCQCGAQFCYGCGKKWSSRHACIEP